MKLAAQGMIIPIVVAIVALTAITAASVFVTVPLVNPADQGMGSLTSSEFLRDHKIDIEERTAANIATVRLSLLKYAYLWLTDTRLSQLSRVAAPLLVDLRYPRAEDIARLASDTPLVLSLDDSVRDELQASTPDSIGRDIQRLGRLEIVLPGNRIVLAQRITPEIPDSPTKSWSLVGLRAGDSDAEQITITILGKFREVRITISDEKRDTEILIVPKSASDSNRGAHSDEQPAVSTVPKDVKDSRESSFRVCREDAGGCNGADEICKRRLALITSINRTEITLQPIVSRAAVDEFGEANLAKYITNSENSINQSLERSGVPGKVTYLPSRVDETLLSDGSECNAVGQLVNVYRRYKAGIERRSRDELAQRNVSYGRIVDLAGTANLAVLVLSTSPHCAIRTGMAPGWTPSIPASREFFFSIIQEHEGSLDGAGTIEHEVGHLLGGRHSLDTQGETVPPTAHGYKAEEFGDLMVTNYARTRRFTSGDPLFSCNGKSLGVSGIADNASEVTKNLTRLASLSQDSIPDTISTSDGFVCQSQMSGGEVHSSNPGAILVGFSSNDARVDSCVSRELRKMFDDADRVRNPKASGEVLRFPAAIVVAGRADQSGGLGANMQLAYLRATALKATIEEALVGTSYEGISIYVCSHGSLRPSEREDGLRGDLLQAARYRNRLAEISFVGDFRLNSLVQDCKSLQASTAELGKAANSPVLSASATDRVF